MQDRRTYGRELPDMPGICRSAGERAGPAGLTSLDKQVWKVKVCNIVKLRPAGMLGLLKTCRSWLPRPVSQASMDAQT